MTDPDAAAPTQAFTQAPPALPNQWADDGALQRYAGSVAPDDGWPTGDFETIGAHAAGDWLTLHHELDTRAAEPEHVPFDAWGNRVDDVHTHPAWDSLKAVGQAIGAVHAGHPDEPDAFARIRQFLLVHLWSPSSGLTSCPLAMTDGAATILRDVDTDEAAAVRAHLIARDPAQAWTSGQWMTERTGGSDVGATTTVAHKSADGWILDGIKWFTSAVDADVALTLARPQGNPDGGRGLALFLVHLRDEAGNLNNIEVLRLKDKLGTRQLPTAELRLAGTRATLIGEPDNGTRRIAPMLTITRLWNAVVAAAGMQRALSLSRSYALSRHAFGKPLIDHPLHAAVLTDIRLRYEISLQLAHTCARLLGAVESGTASDDERVALRVLVPATKGLTGKWAVTVASEALESFGGAGYVEDTHLPLLLRDAQVLPIWEGTTNVMALDVLRALGTTPAERVAALESVTRLVSGMIAAHDIDPGPFTDSMGGLHPAVSAADPHRAREILMDLAIKVGIGLLTAQAAHDLGQGYEATTHLVAGARKRWGRAEGRLTGKRTDADQIALARSST